MLLLLTGLNPNVPLKIKVIVSESLTPVSNPT